MIGFNRPNAFHARDQHHFHCHRAAKSSRVELLSGIQSVSRKLPPITALEICPHFQLLQLNVLKSAGSANIPLQLRNVKPIEGLITTDEIAAARRDWRGACEDFHRHAANR